MYVYIWKIDLWKNIHEKITYSIALQSKLQIHENMFSNVDIAFIVYVNKLRGLGEKDSKKKKS